MLYILSLFMKIMEKLLQLNNYKFIIYLNIYFYLLIYFLLFLLLNLKKKLIFYNFMKKKPNLTKYIQYIQIQKKNHLQKNNI